jgi:hypothetical protein
MLNPLVMKTAPLTVLLERLSGCCIYLERKANGDVVMFHANTVANSPDARTGATQPTYQTGGALVALNRLHAVASASYAGATTGSTNLPKVEYNKRIDNLILAERDLKEHKGKVVAFAAGTTVAAFFRNGAWEFWFQTYARVEHFHADPLSRAAMASERVYKEYRVVEARQFYP